MSILTMCNHCSLKHIRERARREGKIVTLRNGYVHVHKASEPIDTRKWDDGNKQIVAWFMELTNYCVC